MRWLILRFEGVEELDSPLLLTLVFEMDPLCVVRQGGLLSFCIVARVI